MPSEKKTPESQREVILVNILERLSNQLNQFEERLEEIERNQLEMPGVLEKAGLSQNPAKTDNNSELKKLQDAFLRYRSDMLSLVNQQDKLDERLKELYKRQDAIIGAQETISRDTARLDERFNIQEKAVGEHSAFSVRQGETLTRNIDNVNRNAAQLFLDAEKRLEALSRDVESVNRNAAKLYVDAEKRLDTIIRDVEGVNRSTAKLHVDTEKHLKDELREIRRQLEELRKETMRRLLALDKIEASLEILLIRTEPPEKKPFFLVSAFRKIAEFFKVTLPEAFRKILRKRR